MNDSSVLATLTETPQGFEEGKTVEHIMLCVTVVSTNRIIQYDDSAARILKKQLMEYKGVKSVSANVLYNHTKTEQHSNGCGCHFCEPSQDGVYPTSE